MNTVCIYHAHCADGFTSAWVVKEYFTDREVEFIPAKYGDTPPDVTGKEVYIVDFSYPKDEMEKIIRYASRTTVFDHHKTAEKNLSDINVEGSSYNIVFDMDRAGCQITWDYLFPHKTGNRPPVLDHIADRDLWKWEIPDTDIVTSAVFSYPMDFDTWDFIMQYDSYDTLLLEGKAILRKQSKDIESLIHTTVESKTFYANGKYHSVPVANVNGMFASDMGHKLLEVFQDAPFSVTYYTTSEGVYKLSFRSTDDREDVSVIAEAFGGGGHRNASGAYVDVLPWGE